MSQTTPASTAPGNRAKAVGRRTLRFESIDQMTAEVRSAGRGGVRGATAAWGNWTLGQTLGHLATWAEYAYTGTAQAALLRPVDYEVPQASVSVRADASRREDTGRGGEHVGDRAPWLRRALGR